MSRGRYVWQNRHGPSLMMMFAMRSWLCYLLLPSSVLAVTCFTKLGKEFLTRKYDVATSLIANFQWRQRWIACIYVVPLATTSKLKATDMVVVLRLEQVECYKASKVHADPASRHENLEYEGQIYRFFELWEDIFTREGLITSDCPEEEGTLAMTIRKIFGDTFRTLTLEARFAGVLSPIDDAKNPKSTTNAVVIFPVSENDEDSVGVNPDTTNYKSVNDGSIASITETRTAKRNKPISSFFRRYLRSAECYKDQL